MPVNGNITPEIKSKEVFDDEGEVGKMKEVTCQSFMWNISHWP